MGLLLFLIILAVGGFIIGGLARWAVPGPDPMSVPATIGCNNGRSQTARLLPAARSAKPIATR